MNEQEQELFDKRSRELSQVQKRLDAERARHTDLTKALSHVLNDTLAKDARIADLEAEVALWKANDAQARRDWNADREAASKVLDVMGELTEFSTPEEAARDLVEQLQAARAELDALKTSAPTVAPAVDESGEPSAYDAQAPARRVFTEADVSIGDRVVVDWDGKRVEGVITNTDCETLVGGRANAVPTFRLDWKESSSAVVERHSWSDYGSIVEIVAKAPSPGELVKVGDRVRVGHENEAASYVGVVCNISECDGDPWPVKVRGANGLVGSHYRTEVVEILPTEAP